MNVFLIRSSETVAGEGWPAGCRTVCSSRRTAKAVAKNETTEAEKRVHVAVEQRTGRNKSEFWCGTPSEFF